MRNIAAPIEDIFSVDDKNTGESDAQGRVIHSLLDRMHNLVCVCVGDEIEYVNPSGQKLLEAHAPEELHGARFAKFYHPDYSELGEIGFEDLAMEVMPLSMKFLLTSGKTLDTEMWVSQIDGEDRFLLEVRDVTEHLRSARLLRQREQRLEGIINTVADGIVSLDDKGDIVAFNPAAEEIFGFKASEVIGKNLKTLVPSEIASASATVEEPNSEWQDGLGEIREATGLRKDGEEFVVEMAMRSLQQGDSLSYTGVVRDITERKRLEERIHNMAHFDNVTGLPNRNLLSDRLDEAAKRAQRTEHQLALMYIDLNKFKPINDEIGHDAGDKALKTVAERMKESVRESDTVARVGGDEFVILLENIASEEVVRQIADKVLAHIKEPISFSTGPRSIGAAVGIAIFPQHGDDPYSLMKSADQAMYAAKETGENCYRMATVL